MSLQVIKGMGVKYDPVFLKILEDIPGGITVLTDRFPTTAKEVKKGTLLNAVSGTTSVGKYNVIKTVRLTATQDSGATIMQVEPTDHLFIAGEFIHIYGGTAGTIARVSTTAIALSGAQAHFDAPTATVLYETATISTATALYDADAILRDNVEVRRDGVTTLLDNLFAGAVVRGTVDESELPYFVTSTHKTDLTDRIRFA